MKKRPSKRITWNYRIGRVTDRGYDIIAVFYQSGKKIGYIWPDCFQRPTPRHVKDEFLFLAAAEQKPNVDVRGDDKLPHCDGWDVDQPVGSQGNALPLRNYNEGAI